MTRTVHQLPLNRRCPANHRHMILRTVAAGFVGVALLLPAFPAQAKSRVGFSFGLGVGPGYCAPPPPPVVVHQSHGRWEWIEEQVLTRYETREEQVWVPETRRTERVWDPVRRVWTQRLVIMPGHYRTQLVEAPVYETVQRQVWVETPVRQVYHRPAPVMVRPHFGLHVSVR